MREATTEEARRIAEREAEIFGTTTNLCQSIPPRHAEYSASDGHTYCTRCGERLT